MIADLQAGREVTTEYIKEIHGILCREAIESVPGRFKTQPNMVIGADFIPFFQNKIVYVIIFRFRSKNDFANRILIFTLKFKQTNPKRILK